MKMETLKEEEIHITNVDMVNPILTGRPSGQRGLCCLSGTAEQAIAIKNEKFSLHQWVLRLSDIDHPCDIFR